MMMKKKMKKMINYAIPTVDKFMEGKMKEFRAIIRNAICWCPLRVIAPSQKDAYDMVASFLHTPERKAKVKRHIKWGLEEHRARYYIKSIREVGDAPPGQEPGVTVIQV
jgi:spore maturation protein CgeB